MSRLLQTYLPGDLGAVGEDMYSLMQELFPICRSITGNGVKQTLGVLQKRIPLEIREVPTGTQVFDWIVPKEWNIRNAYVKNSRGEKIVDFRRCNLHVVGYSTPVNATMTLQELKPHLHTLPEYPDWIPYLTSYYNEDWGFCMPHRQYEQLAGGNYEVVIESSLEDGNLRYGEVCLNGESDDEVLLSTYICHPSLCNDNLSGVVLLTALAETLMGKALRYSYRFLFIPETIGAITWLSRNRDNVRKIKHGLIATCVGDPGSLTYKKSRQGNALIDRAVEKVLIDSGDAFVVRDFWPTGSDERQFCSPCFDLPVGSLMRTVYGEFPEYHTSGDNLDFVQPQYLADSLKKYISVLYVLEHDRRYLSTNPCCEPQLGKRGLYRKLGSQKNMKESQTAMMWLLNLADGDYSLLDIAMRSGLRFDLINEVADILLQHELLKEA